MSPRFFLGTSLIWFLRVPWTKWYHSRRIMGGWGVGVGWGWVGVGVGGAWGPPLAHGLKHFPRYWPFVGGIHQKPVTRSFDVFFDLRLIKRLSKHSQGWWFETLSRPLWRHCNCLSNTGYVSKTHLVLKSREISFIHNIWFSSPISFNFAQQYHCRALCKISKRLVYVMGKGHLARLELKLRFGRISHIMMTSSNGNIFRVTGPLCGEFTGPGEFPTQRPVTRSFDVFFDLRLNKRLSKQPWGWWFETPSWSLWCQCNDCSLLLLRSHQKGN